MTDISICLWFDNQAEEAVKFYTDVFPNSKVGKTARYTAEGAKVSGQKEGSVMTIDLQVENMKLEALNGGPIFKFSPSLSMTIACGSESEIDQLWKKLAQGGNVRMELQKYPWAEKYGWVADKFGVDWQLSLKPDTNPKITPSILFVDALFGKGEEAINFYTSVFRDGKVDSIVRDDKAGSVMYSEFTLSGKRFSLMEGQGKHGHTPTNATSIVVNCDTQDEIDELWDKLSAGGTIEECGWFKDKFGVSWQIVPRILKDLSADPAKSEKAMRAMFQMKKFDIAKLQAAVR